MKNTHTTFIKNDMYKFLLTLLFLIVSTLSWSQGEQEKLEKRKAQIQRDIEAQEALLNSKNSIQKSVSSIIEQQKVKIQLREKLINTTEKQSKLLKNNMYINQIAINNLKKELVVLKEDYSKMILKSYKSRSEQSRAMFLLSSENFLQAYKRAQYMKQYASYRKIQGEEIKVKSGELTVYNKKLDVQKTEKEKLIEEQEKERMLLQKEKREQEQLVNSIKKDKKKIIAQIKQKQKEAKQIDRQINNLILEAIREANRKNAEAVKKANPKKVISVSETKEIETSTKIILTPEAKIVSDNFKSNKGRLPWPVEKGSIYIGFGDQPHPIFKSVSIHNSGIDIETEGSSNARSVFDGIVTKVIVFSPVNNAVFIQHGEYFTVYQNLSSISVSKGDKVARKQNIGKIRTSGDSGKTILKFMVMQNTVPNNPRGWLSSGN